MVRLAIYRFLHEYFNNIVELPMFTFFRHITYDSVPIYYLLSTYLFFVNTKTTLIA